MWLDVVKYNIELNIIGVLCMVDTVRGDYLGEWRNVQSEQHWSKNGSLHGAHRVYSQRWTTAFDRLEPTVCDVPCMFVNHVLCFYKMKLTPFKSWTTSKNSFFGWKPQREVHMCVCACIYIVIYQQTAILKYSWSNRFLTIKFIFIYIFWVCVCVCVCECVSVCRCVILWNQNIIATTKMAVCWFYHQLLSF